MTLNYDSSQSDPQGSSRGCSSEAEKLQLRILHHVRLFDQASVLELDGLKRNDVQSSCEELRRLAGFSPSTFLDTIKEVFKHRFHAEKGMQTNGLRTAAIELLTEFVLKHPDRINDMSSIDWTVEDCSGPFLRSLIDKKSMFMEIIKSISKRKVEAKSTQHPSSTQTNPFEEVDEPAPPSTPASPTSDPSGRLSPLFEPISAPPHASGSSIADCRQHSPTEVSQQRKRKRAASLDASTTRTRPVTPTSTQRPPARNTRLNDTIRVDPNPSSESSRQPTGSQGRSVLSQTPRSLRPTTTTTTTTTPATTPLTTPPAPSPSPPTPAPAPPSAPKTSPPAAPMSTASPPRFRSTMRCQKCNTEWRSTRLGTMLIRLEACRCCPNRSVKEIRRRHREAGVFSRQECKGCTCEWLSEWMDFDRGEEYDIRRCACCPKAGGG